MEVMRQSAEASPLPDAISLTADAILTAPSVAFWVQTDQPISTMPTLDSADRAGVALQMVAAVRDASDAAARLQACVELHRHILHAWPREKIDTTAIG